MQNLTTRQQRSSRRVRALVSAALVAALTAALGPLSVPIEPVPVTFQTFCVALAAMLLPAGWAASAMALYLALGAAGLPVFAKGAAGLAVVTGPTGGYLIGFILAAGTAALVRAALRAIGAGDLVADAGAGVALLVVVYGVGTAWLAFSLNATFAEAAALGVLPFVLGDAIKVAVAIAIAEGVRKAGVAL